MATTATDREFTPIPADPERLDNLAKRFTAETDSEAAEVTVSVSYQFEDGSSDIRQMQPAALPTLVPIAPPISLITLRPADTLSACLSIHVRQDHVLIYAEASSMSLATALVETAVSTLGLEPHSPSDERRLFASLERRLDAVQSLQEEDIRLRCFLSYRFKDADTRVANDVQRFLELQGVEVLTGSSYEPRRVEDKVHSRLSSALDFVVYLVTASGDSSWLRDEVSEARVTGIPVIPLVEEGVAFEGGLFGNVEYIPFAPGHVGDVWIAFVEALAFIRAGRRRGSHLKDESEPD